MYELKTERFEIQYIESKIDNFAWESHCHSRFEMIAVVEGEVSIMLEGTSYRIKPEQAIIIPPLCYHSIRADTAKPYKRVTALFEATAIPDTLRAEFFGEGSDVAISFGSRRQIEKLMKICKDDRPPFYAPLAESLMVQMLYDTLKTDNNGAGSERDEFLQSVIAYIDAHLREKILLDDLARHTLRSKSSFCHLFEERMNVSPKQYILQKKLALANKMIGEGTPPTVAAIYVGYENYSNFYRTYKKHFGKSPNA